MAVLKVNSDSGLDLIEQFVPFLAECIRAEGSKAVSLPALSSRMRETFHIRMPDAALKTVLSRAVHQGLLRQENRTYIPDYDRLALYNLGPARARVLREHAALVAKFIDYARRTFEMELDDDAAERGLLNYVALRTAPLLGAVVEGVLLDRNARTLDPLEVALDGFVAHLHVSDPVGFDYLTTIVKGSVLASVLFLDEIGQAGVSFRGVDFYLDTPLLMRACGFDGDVAADAATDLLHLLSAEGARLRCFPHSVKEMEGILEAALVVVRDPRRHRDAWGETAKHFLDVGYKGSDIVQIISTLPARLGNLDVMVTPTPGFTTELSTDEAAFEGLLRQRVSFTRDEQLVADVKSLTAIHRLREGRTSSRLELSRALFVTTNYGLVQAARDQFKDIYRAGSIPVAIGANDLATIAWLKQPGTVPDLPAKIVIADCYAALSPTDTRAWQAYLQRIRELEAAGGVSADEYRLLRHDLQVRAVLLHRFVQTGEAFAEGDVQQVLARARENIAADVRADLDDTKTALDNETLARRLAEERADEAARRALDAETTAAKTTEAMREQREASIEKLATSVVWFLARVPLVLVGIAAVLGVWSTLPAFALPLNHLSGWPRYLFLTPAVCFVVVAGLGGAFGGDVWVAVRWLERKLRRPVTNWVARWVAPPAHLD